MLGDGRKGYYLREDIAWAGFLFEDFLARWFTDLGLSFERHGGRDTRPDFEVEGRPLGARVRVYRPDIDMVLTWPSVQNIPDEIIFGVYDRAASFIYIAGVITAERYREVAREVHKGEQVLPNFPAHVDVLVTDARSLTAPLTWVGEIRSQATAEASGSAPPESGEPASAEPEDPRDLGLRDLMTRAMKAQGKVDPDAVFEEAEQLDLDETIAPPPVVQEEMFHEPPPVDEALDFGDIENNRPEWA